jgi:hypothetical protein
VTTKQKVLVGAGVLLVAALVYARTRKRKSTASDGSITIGGVECASGDCGGASASGNWLTSSAPDSFLYLQPWEY